MTNTTHEVLSKGGASLKQMLPVIETLSRTAESPEDRALFAQMAKDATDSLLAVERRARECQPAPCVIAWAQGEPAAQVHYNPPPTVPRC